MRLWLEFIKANGFSYPEFLTTIGLENILLQLSGGSFQSGKVIQNKNCANFQMVLILYSELNLEFKFRLAFCLSINKGQGQENERVGIYLPSPVFSHGTLDIFWTIICVVYYFLFRSALHWIQSW